MSTSPATHSVLSIHTFGRDHREPPPLPSSVQLGQVASVAPMVEPAVLSSPVHAASLPQDFDQLVRSVGEW